MPDSWNDQRRALRIRVDLPARFRSESQSIDGRAHDLSAHGVRFVGNATCDAPVPGPVFLEIDLPDEDGGGPLAVRGTICWSAEAPHHAVGIRFTGIGAPERRRLANFVIRRTCERGR